MSAKQSFAKTSNLFFKVWLKKSGCVYNQRNCKYVGKKVYKKRLIARYTYKLTRPLLNCSRANITSACISTKIPVYPDSSNLKIKYSRNRIRKQIIPSIKFFFNPQIENTIFKFSDLLSKELFLNQFYK